MGKRTGAHAEVDRPGEGLLIGTAKAVVSCFAKIRIPFPIPKPTEYFNQLPQNALGEVLRWKFNGS